MLLFLNGRLADNNPVLTGPGAPKPITPEQNASSNCWPIQPKSYDLARVMRIDTTVC